MCLAFYILWFLAFMDPFAILALLPGVDEVSDQGDLSDQGNLSADLDGGADAFSDQGNLSADLDVGEAAVSDQGNLSADADGGADDQIQPGSVKRNKRRQEDRTRIQKKKIKNV